MEIIEDFHNDNWVTARVYYLKGGEEKNRTQVINVMTGKRYLHDDTSSIAIKAALLATIWIPFYTMMNVVFHVIRAVTLLFSVLVRSYNSFEVKNFTHELSLVLTTTILALAKAPICAIGMEFCAICAIFSPITWRAHLADVEAFWRGTDRQHDLFRHQAVDKESEDLARCSDFFSNPRSSYGVFAAYCFQPLGASYDDHILKIETLSPT